MTVEEKANNWIINGRVGLSSKTMWACLMNVPEFRIYHPCDAGDFGRCYSLLEAVPEWKEEVYFERLKGLSSEWFNLIKNWDKLTQMYKESRFSDLNAFMVTLFHKRDYQLEFEYGQLMQRYKTSSNYFERMRIFRAMNDINEKLQVPTIECNLFPLFSVRKGFFDEFGNAKQL
jgi:hypothetical protein